MSGTESRREELRRYGNYTRSVLDKSGAHCYSRRNDCKDK